MQMDAKAYVREITTAAKASAAMLALTDGSARINALMACASALRQSSSHIKRQNAKDLVGAKEMKLSFAMIERLTLDDKAIEKMACAIEQIALQVDPVGEAIEAYNRPNGLRIEKRRVPIGVIAVIFESRPNVTTDAAALCLKSANACILRGGKEAIHSNMAIADAMKRGLSEANLPADAVTVIDNTDRAVVGELCKAQGMIDLIIPRGGEGLIRAVVEQATIPVIKHYTGNCHVYLHHDAEESQALDIVLNAKCQRPGVCNAMETLLLHTQAAQRMLTKIAERLTASGVELRGCPASRKLVPAMKQATDADWGEEYLDLVLAVKVVENLDEAISHINAFGSGHTDAIVTTSIDAANRFVAGVDSASVMVNASTRFSDGGEYGLGAEVGISTDKLHARGPMGAKDLTTYKWIVTGQGHIRS